MKKHIASLGNIGKPNPAIVLGCIAGLFLIIIGFTTPKFFTFTNFIGLSKQISILGLLAIGITPVLIVKGFDLSVGSIAALSIMTSGYVAITTGNIVASVITGLATGVLIGFLNALLIEGVGLNAVIITLATMTAVRGLDTLLVKQNYFTFAQKITNEDLLGISRGMIGGVPTPFVIFGCTAIILGTIMKKTTFGRKIYSIGNNELAASIHGINTKVHKGLLYIISGAIAGLAGVIALSRIGMVTSAVAVGWEFQAVTAVIIGGTSLTGGKGTIAGSAIGVLIIVAVRNLMTLNRISGFYQDFITGFIIIIALLIDRYFSGVRD